MKEVSHKGPHVIWSHCMKCPAQANLERQKVDWLPKARRMAGLGKMAEVSKLLLGWWKCLKIDCGDGCTLYECTKAIELHTLSWQSVWYTFISIKLLKSKYSNNNSGDMTGISVDYSVSTAHPGPVLHKLLFWSANTTSRFLKETS